MSRGLKEERTITWIFRKRTFREEVTGSPETLRQDCPLVNPGMSNDEPVSTGTGLDANKLGWRRSGRSWRVNSQSIRFRGPHFLTAIL